MFLFNVIIHEYIIQIYKIKYIEVFFQDIVNKYLKRV